MALATLPVAPVSGAVPITLATALLTLPFWGSAVLKAVQFRDTIAEVQALGLPVPTLVALGTIGVQLLGSLAVILNMGSWLGVFALSGFTLLASLLAHSFWQDGFVPHQFAPFTANMGLVGGLILAGILNMQRGSS